MISQILLIAASLGTPVHVTSVYDGDTFTLANGDKVRLAGVNTPELRPPEPYGIEARDSAEGFLQRGDIELIGAGNRDAYGRVLAAAEVDGHSLTEHLLRQGMGHLFLIPPVGQELDVPALLAAQQLAQAENLGIWSTERYQGALHITSFHANASGDDRENVNGEYMRICNISGEPINVDGYRITDAGRGNWVLPSLTIPAGHTVKVHSGVGVNQIDPRDQLQIFLGSDYPIWNNRHDRATIYDRFGSISDVRVHESEHADR
jgi:endonuclease YncB( thermonuclease family)